MWMWTNSDLEENKNVFSSLMSDGLWQRNPSKIRQLESSLTHLYRQGSHSFGYENFQDFPGPQKHFQGSSRMPAVTNHIYTSYDSCIHTPVYVTET